MLEKDEKIIKLSRELRKAERKNSEANANSNRSLSPFNAVS